MKKIDNFVKFLEGKKLYIGGKDYEIKKILFREEDYGKVENSSDAYNAFNFLLHSFDMRFGSGERWGFSSVGCLRRLDCATRSSYYYRRKLHSVINAVDEKGEHYELKMYSGFFPIFSFPIIRNLKEKIVIRKNIVNIIKWKGIEGEVLQVPYDDTSHNNFDIFPIRIISPTFLRNTIILVKFRLKEHGNVSIKSINLVGRKKLLCRSCLSEYVNKEKYDVGGGLCEKCCPDYQRCIVCGSIIWRNSRYPAFSLVHVYDNKVHNHIKEVMMCSSCISKVHACNQCNILLLEGKGEVRYITSEGRNIYYCIDCFDKMESFVCARCGGKYKDVERRYLGENSYCRRCYNIILEERSHTLHRYDYIPIFDKKKKKWDNKLLLGFELEVMTKIPRSVNGNEYLIEKAMSIKKWLKEHNLYDTFYIKNDGSLRDVNRRSGFEVNSHPISLNALKQVKIKSLLEYLRSIGFVSYEAVPCGFHVHLSADFFSPYNIDSKDFYCQTFRDNIGKLLLFFSINGEKIYTFSKRKVRDYCLPLSFDKYSFFDITDSESSFLDYVKQQNRYSVINITNIRNNIKKTVEIRSFKGTLEHNRFIATLQFCDAIAHYIKQISFISLVTNKTNSWKDFFLWVKDANAYGHLVKYVKNNNLVQL